MYPFHAVTDYRNHDSEDASNINGPEHRITHINEIIDAPDDLVRGTYRDLASMAVIINSSRWRKPTGPAVGVLQGRNQGPSVAGRPGHYRCN